jgi:Spo0E like sporulation regulatory protein
MMNRLEEEMERLRRVMHQQAAELGLNHPAVIELSQQLDEFHNQWNRWQIPSSSQPDVDNRAAYIIRRYTSQIKEAALSRA